MAKKKYTIAELKDFINRARNSLKDDDLVGEAEEILGIPIDIDRVCLTVCCESFELPPGVDVYDPTLYKVTLVINGQEVDCEVNVDDVEY